MKAGAVLAVRHQVEHLGWCVLRGASERLMLSQLASRPNRLLATTFVDKAPEGRLGRHVCAARAQTGPARPRQRGDPTRPGQLVGTRRASQKHIRQQLLFCFTTTKPRLHSDVNIDAPGKKSVLFILLPSCENFYIRISGTARLYN